MNLQQLAEKLGLARSTISRALREDPRISHETRVRVRAAADEIGYRENPYISVLMTRVRRGGTAATSPVIAYINPEAHRGSWRYSRHWHVTFLGAVARAQELGFQVEEFWLGEPGMTPARMTRILQARGIRAILLGPGRGGAAPVYSPEGFAVVACDVQPAGDTIRRVSTDYTGNTLKALRALQAQGYRRIGLALEDVRADYLLHLPRMAFLEFEEGLCPAERTGYWIGPPGDIAGLARWLHAAQPDALVTASWIPQGAIQPLGLRIPQDLGIAQLDPMFFPFMHSGIDGRYDQVGRTAIDVLVSQIHRSEFHAGEPVHVLRPGSWCPGFSTLDRRDATPRRGYDPLQREVLAAAATGDAGRFAAARAPLVEQRYGVPFAFASTAQSRAWRPLALGPVANSRWEAPVWPPRFTAPSALPPLGTGRTFRGVPFAFGGEAEAWALCLNRSGVQPSPPQRKLKVGLAVRAVYFLHFAFYAWDAQDGGEYRLRFASGRVERLRLKPFFPPTQPAELAAFQDSWAAMPQFESESTKPVLVSSPDDPFGMNRFGYVLQCVNTAPADILETIEFLSGRKTETALIVAGVTALL